MSTRDAHILEVTSGMPGFWNLSVSHFDFAKATQNRGGAKSTPALSLSKVYGAIAYYLDHQAELDRVSCAKRSSTPPSENAGHGRPESQLDRTLCGHREGAHGGARAEPTQRNMTTRAPERKRRRVAAHSKRSLVRDCIPTNDLGRSDEWILKNIQKYIKI